MIATSANRVNKHTSEKTAARLDIELEARLRYYAAHPDQIDGRLAELDREWDVERFLELNASTLALAGVVLAFRRSRKFLVLSAVVLGFLWQHAVQGWCPPLPILRRLGFRTVREIEDERNGLRMLRGDFDSINHDEARHQVETILNRRGT